MIRIGGGESVSRQSQQMPARVDHAAVHVAANRGGPPTLAVRHVILELSVIDLVPITHLSWDAAFSSVGHQGCPN